MGYLDPEDKSKEKSLFSAMSLRSAAEKTFKF